MRHPDGARRRRRGGLALDGGLVLSAVLVHSCNLRGRGQRDAKPSDTTQSPISIQGVTFK